MSLTKKNRELITKRWFLYLKEAPKQVQYLLDEAILTLKVLSRAKPANRKVLQDHLRWEMILLLYRLMTQYQKYHRTKQA